jgi:hypothetical protein
MKRLLAVALVTSTAVMAPAVRAHAGASTDAALALGAFAVFNQLVRGETVFSGFGFGRPVPAPPVVVYVQPPVPVVYVTPPPPVYVASPVYVAPPPVVYRGAVRTGHGKVKYVKGWPPRPHPGKGGHGRR